MSDVSRETQAKLDRYADLLKKWSPRINLVSKASLNDAALRHFDDSKQIFELAPNNIRKWVDLGSGGGFPGAVVAILAQEQVPNLKCTLIESDQRKATFLRTVSRETSVPFTVLSQRIEDVPRQNADVVSARALAELTALLGFVERHISKTGRALLMKGVKWKEEVAEAEKTWNFSYEVHKSKTDPDAVILEIGDISRV